MELNPDHPATKAARDSWHTIAALIMWKLKATQVAITDEELDQFACLPDVSMPTIIIHYHKMSMEVLLMPLDQVKAYAKKQGVEL